MDIILPKIECLALEIALEILKVARRPEPACWWWMAIGTAQCLKPHDQTR